MSNSKKYITETTTERQKTKKSITLKCSIKYLYVCIYFFSEHVQIAISERQTSSGHNEGCGV